MSRSRAVSTATVTVLFFSASSFNVHCSVCSEPIFQLYPWTRTALPTAPSASRRSINVQLLIIPSQGLQDGQPERCEVCDFVQDLFAV